MFQRLAQNLHMNGSVCIARYIGSGQTTLTYGRWCCMMHWKMEYLVTGTAGMKRHVKVLQLRTQIWI